MEFFERAKSFAGLYGMANAPERRELVSLVSSNRWVDGKDVVLEPSKWLVPVQNRKPVPPCDSTRPQTRMPIEHIMSTFREHRYEVERFNELMARHLPAKPSTKFKRAA